MKKDKESPIKITKSRDKELFPWQSFLWRIDNLDEKRVCWFECEEHAEKYIRRYNPKYKLIHYTGK
jgi:hypothetical protein